jgi:hypothetical protein
MEYGLNTNKERNLLIDSIQYRIFYAEINLDKIPTSISLDVFPNDKISAEIVGVSSQSNPSFRYCSGS